LIQDSEVISRRTLLAALPLAAMGAADRPSVAITMDDMYWSRLVDPMDANRRILNAARKYGVQFGLFVIGENAASETGRGIVRSWVEAGHLIGNHTWSHRRYNGISFEEFSEDVLRADALLGESLSAPRMFRFPTLAEGDTSSKRDRMREFLAAHGYRNGHVTIDASDWYYDSRLRERLKKEPGFDVRRFRRPYLDHLWDRARFYDGLSRKVLGRSVPHTLLVHYNLLNALFLGDVLAMFVKRGWRIGGAADAYRDPVFQRTPNSMPSGQSLIWALAKETGRFEGELRYPGEDDVYEKPGLDRLGL
jgi:peptidoglycan/xylan/chitin deacetylase (PgdA/CDA1 family)